MNKQAANSVIMTSMLVVIVGITLAKGYVNSFQRFIRTKIGAENATKAANAPSSTVYGGPGGVTTTQGGVTSPSGAVAGFAGSANPATANKPVAQ